MFDIKPYQTLSTESYSEVLHSRVMTISWCQLLREQRR